MQLNDNCAVKAVLKMRERAESMRQAAGDALAEYDQILHLIPGGAEHVTGLITGAAEQRGKVGHLRESFGDGTE